MGYANPAMHLAIIISAGESVIVSWTVENTGSGITATDQWFDRVYWSDDEQFGKQKYSYIASIGNIIGVSFQYCQQCLYRSFFITSSCEHCQLYSAFVIILVNCVDCCLRYL